MNAWEQRSGASAPAVSLTTSERVPVVVTSYSYRMAAMAATGVLILVAVGIVAGASTVVYRLLTDSSPTDRV